MKQKNLLFIILSILCLILCSSCTSTKNEIRLSNAYSYDGEFLYFNTPYKYTRYSFMLNYVYSGEEACTSYGFKVTNKKDEDKSISDGSLLINGVTVTSSNYPYLIKGSTISVIIVITSSNLAMINTANYYEEFTVELYIGQEENYTVLASAEFTFEQVKQMCLSTN